MINPKNEEARSRLRTFDGYATSDADNPCGVYYKSISFGKLGRTFDYCETADKPGVALRYTNGIASVIQFDLDVTGEEIAVCGYEKILINRLTGMATRREALGKDRYERLKRLSKSEYQLTDDPALEYTSASLSGCAKAERKF